MLTAALYIDDGSVGHCEERYVVYAGEYRRSLETTLLRSYIEADGLQWASRWDLLSGLLIRVTHEEVKIIKSKGASKVLWVISTLSI